MRLVTPLAFTLLLSLSACGQQVPTGGTGGASAAAGRTGTSTGVGTAGAGIDTNAGSRTVDTNFGTGFVGRSDNTGRFIGNTNAGQQGFGGGFGRGGFNVNDGGGRQTNQVQQAERKARFELRAAFDAPPVRASTVRANVNTRFARLSTRLPGASGLRITTGDVGEVFLDGSVRDARTRRIAETLVKMEPGVRVVRNRLTVDAPGPLPLPRR